MNTNIVTGINKGIAVSGGYNTAIKACAVGKNDINAPSIQAIGTQRLTAFSPNHRKGNHRVAYTKKRG